MRTLRVKMFFLGLTSLVCLWLSSCQVSDIEPRFVCKACGKRDADVRPHFEPARMGITN